MKFIKNNLYILKHIKTASPWRMLFQIYERSFSFLYGSFYYLIFFRYIINASENGKSFMDVMLFLVLFTIIGLVDSINKAIFNNIFKPISDQEILQHLNMMIFNKAKKCDISSYENPEFFQQFTKSTVLINEKTLGILENITIILSSIFVLSLNIGFAIFIAPEMLLICIIPAILMFVFAKKENKYRYEYKMQRIQYDREAEYIKRSVYFKEYAKEIRLTNIFSVLTNQFDNALRNITISIKKHGPIIAIYQFTKEFFTEILLFIAMQSYLVYKYISGNGMLLGDFVSLSGACYNIVNFADNINGAYIKLLESSSFIDNFKEYLNKEITIVSGDKKPIFNKSISLENISFNYGDTNIIKNLSFRINKGEKIAIVGHNGAGKTSLIKVLLRLYDTNTGGVFLDDVNIRDIDLNEYRQLFSCVFQDYQLYATSTKDNISMDIADENDELYEKALKKSGLDIDVFPNKINTQLTKEYDENGIILSMGQQQKLALSRVFASNAPIAILDEPSSSLDPISERTTFENMFNACVDKTVIFISHRLASVVFADRIILLKNGSIQEVGTHKELMKLNKIYADMYNKQNEHYRKGDML